MSRQFKVFIEEVFGVPCFATVRDVSESRRVATLYVDVPAGSPIKQFSFDALVHPVTETPDLASERGVPLERVLRTLGWLRGPAASQPQ